MAKTHETITLKLDGAHPLVPSVTVPIYWKLFWVPLLGRTPAALYELLVIAHQTSIAPTREWLRLHLGIQDPELREAYLQLERFALLSHQPGTGTVTLVFPPTVMVGELANHTLPAALREPHQAFLREHGFEPAAADSVPAAKQGLIFDEVGAPKGKIAPRTAAAAPKATAPGSRDIVTYFSELKTKAQNNVRWEVRGWPQQMAIAGRLLRTYTEEELRGMMDVYFRDVYKGTRAPGLQVIARDANALYNQMKSGVLPVAPGRPSKMLRPGVSGYGKRKTDDEDPDKDERY